jgi:hypothetical protein
MTGRRCEARAFLELDHITPRALGGSGEPDELRVLCRAHNRLYAEQVYGRQLIEQKMHLRYRKCATAATMKVEPSAPEGSANDAELAAMYLKIERALIQQGFAQNKPPGRSRSFASATIMPFPVLRRPSSYAKPCGS